MGFAQGLLFRELYAPGEQGRFEITHRQATSTWNPRYGQLSKTEVNLASQRFSCASQKSETSNCHYKLEAGHELQRFSTSPTFGGTLENPQFRGMIERTGRFRTLAELGVNSPSDRPFQSFDDTNISFTAVVSPNEVLARKTENYWLYFLNYSNTRAFLPNVPLPGFSYTIVTKSGWVYSLGAPFLTLSYIDFPKWSFRTMVGPFFYSSELAYGPPVLQVGISSTWKQDSYFVSTRTLREERLFIDERDVSLNLKHPLSETMILEWKLSYFMHQNLRYGRSYSRRSAPTEDLGTSAAITVNLRARLDSFVNQ